MSERKTKLIFITGGVISSIGKGIAAASIGTLLKGRGLNVSMLKLDPYLNVDPGTMNPNQHGEVFVTADGAETDLDLGHYERYIDVDMSRKSSVTAGQIYQRVLDKERNGEYLGATVQVIPHVTNEIKAAIHAAAEDRDILICEVGGTVGDIESLPFLEAIRQLRADVGIQSTFYGHVSYVPSIKTAGELKTKPTQHSVKELLSIGIQPDALILRATVPLPDAIKEKISLFCNVPKKAVINCPDVNTTYAVPQNLHKEGLDETILTHLNIWTRKAKMEKWNQVVHDFNNPEDTVKVGIVGKYVSLVESYKSVHEALVHAGIALKTKVEFAYIDAEDLEKPKYEEELAGLDAILVPGGFGERGVEGKINAVNFARKNNVPYFGICLGLQIAMLEYARNEAGITDAASQEFSPESKDAVIHLMESQKGVRKKGGTMRLGNYLCHLKPGTRAHEAYGEIEILERHRHRFEVNNTYKAKLEEKGMVFSGIYEEENLVEVIELPNHPHFIACQFHPEFKSRPLKPHPLFKSFVTAAKKKK